ncbi:MAG TPA: DNA ligase D [Tahibacter sp.]|uniref:DNA ligase D n=1 Tax=Tahibacter sp. TaxID=2056211 RepID=UPI002B572936|nr:DNA ligase D [Tahibacter sp.]HSX62509.1 DNA ligase D [Tahibacter sp.]
MSLAAYRKKRNFSRTREPAPDDAATHDARSLFVVQLHHARRRHYDFRLQVGDTLKSWAVPKGPSFDPEVKRLAAEVEDHPLAYAEFEGEIPHGEYGGGHVAQFDRGVWSSDGDVAQQLRKGHLRFELFGNRLKGGWHLVRTRRGRGKQHDWLLIKDDDAYAGPTEADDLLAGVTPPPERASTKRTATKRAATKSAAPAQRARGGRRIDWEKRASALPGARRARLRDAAFAPQLAQLAAQIPPGDGWLHELKWDGYRLVALLRGGKARLWSRNAIEWTDKLPDIVAALERLRVDDAALDGELIAGGGAHHDFSLLQSTLAGDAQASLTYVLFDLVHLSGFDLHATPLHVRKTLLAELLKQPPGHLAYSSHIEGDGAAAFELATSRDFEGTIAKRADSPYRGGRSDDWRKIKRAHSDEYAVVGFTAPRGSRSGFGSLLLARHVDGAWRFAGRVGSGFDDAQMRHVAELLPARTSTTPSVPVDAIDTDLRTARWFAPAFVVEVFSRGEGRQGLLRQPSLKAIRMDKTVADLAGSRRRSATENRTAAKASPRRRRSRDADAADTEAGDVAITHPERLVFPEDDIRKQDVVDYYRAVAPWLLREIAGRPLSIVRCPDGIAQACFFQKHRTAGIKHVDRVRLKEESGATRDYLVVNDERQLLELVQFNALEFHPWGSHAANPDRADRLVFDLDPGPGVSWSDIKRAARDLRDLLAQTALESFLRTSGGKGLHVVVPLNPGCDWDLVKRFAQGFARSLAEQQPDRFVAVMTKSKRNGLIFVDYLRNGRGATSVASYSLRARAGAPVAMPIDWSELARLTSPAAFDLHSARRRLARRKHDPWDGIETLKQNLSRWAH